MPADLTFNGVPVIPRFDVADRRMRPFWAGAHGTVARFERAGAYEAELIAELRTGHNDAVVVTVERTVEGIEVGATRK